jgi:hypothetical protein
MRKEDSCGRKAAFPGFGGKSPPEHKKKSARQVSVTLREDLIGAPAQEMNDRGAASFGNHPFGLTFRASRLYNPKEGH